MREKCEDSSLLWQPITNLNVRVGVSALTCESTDIENIYEPNVSLEDKANIFAVVGLLKKALRKLAKEEYHSAVDDLPSFVNEFNQKRPEYEQRLGYQIVYEEAGKLKQWGGDKLKF